MTTMRYKPLFYVVGLLELLFLRDVFGKYSDEPSNVPCSFLDSINITDGTHLSNSSYLHDGIVYSKDLVGVYNYKIGVEGKLIKVQSHLRGCICKIKPCIRVCCNKQYIMDNGCEYVEDYYSTDLRVKHKSGNYSIVDIYQNFGIIIGSLCDNTYYLEPETYTEDEWELLENGSIIRIYDATVLTKDEYCLSPMRVENSTEFVINPALCFKSPAVKTKDVIYSYAMLFSVPFIIFTIIIYVSIPELRNLHGKSLICYLTGLALGYSVLSFILITSGSTVNNVWCSILGYIIYYSFMSSFLWLSVISFDLWWNFRGTRGINKFNERKRFLLYGLYAWGISACLLALTIIAQNSNIPKQYKPGIGGGEYCWLDGNLWIQIVYFYGPILIIFIFNITMFILTSLKIHQVQREMTKIIAREDSRKNLHGEKDRFGLFLRLFIVMGVTWSMELISWLVGNDNELSKIFYITDICNAIQGFVIFALFVLKKKVKRLILKRYNSLKGIHQRTSMYSSKTNSSNITMPTMQIDRLITNDSNSKNLN